MSTKSTEAIREHKTRTVEIKLLIPYAIIVIMATLVAGVIFGWNSHVAQEGQVQAEAQTIVSSLSKTQAK